MIDWLSKKRREEKQQQAEEADLKASIAEKISQYEASQEVNTDDEDDHTELVVNGKKVRVAKQQITLTDD